MTPIPQINNEADARQAFFNKKGLQARRDMFAAAALTGLIGNPNNREHIENYVSAAFAFADAMIKESDK